MGDRCRRKLSVTISPEHCIELLWQIPSEPPKKPSSKITKAQRRAQQAEFNRQLWEEAEGPREPNYFLETRGVVPKADFKPPPKLLSRKPPAPASDEVNGDVSSDEADGEKKKPTIEEQRALAAKEREEKQRKYEERRLELFGSTTATTTTRAAGSGTSSPGETPPGSRSSTPNRARGRGGRKNEPSSRPLSSASTLSLKPSNLAPSTGGKKELFDPSYNPRPDSMSKRSESREKVIEPIRSPRGPDGSGRGGFGFAPRGGRDGLRASLDTQSKIDADNSIES